MVRFCHPSWVEKIILGAFSRGIARGLAQPLATLCQTSGLKSPNLRFEIPPNLRFEIPPNLRFEILNQMFEILNQMFEI